MVNMKDVSDSPDVVGSHWRDKMVIEGQGKDAEIIAFPQQLEGIAGVLTSAVRHDGIVGGGFTLDGDNEFIKLLSIVSLP